ncbi:hypothetical protein CDL15_Pgr016742 [Punica granatum]|uniref:Uncharacterized protein n=1 Tax=Punica granatum TaxID=22663 RepID=A0A218WWU2_PUNGR|nr:hypothetical protein CDL15_Pgr016742 [Punica granatum]
MSSFVCCNPPDHLMESKGRMQISRVSRLTSRYFKDSDIEEDFLEGVNVKAFTFSLPQYSPLHGAVI